MRRAVRAIIFKDDQMLVMKRNKFGHKYLTLIGGGVDLGEELLQTLYREVKEESGLQVQNPRLVFIEHSDELYGTQYIYLCDYVSGEPKLSEHSIEAKINQDGKNLYETSWMPTAEFKTAPFLSETLKQAILNGLEKGWPAEPLELHSRAEVRYTDTA